MKDNYSGCKFCGQTIMVTKEFEKYEEEAATMQCSCDKAKAYAEKVKTYERAKQKISELFGEGAEESGLGGASLEVEETLCKLAKMINDGKIKDVSTNLSDRVQAKISKTSKGKIKIQRKDSVNYQSEA